MNHHSSPRTMRRLSVVALSSALLLAGCGDDGDDEAKDDTATTASAEDAGIQSACDAYTDISKAMGKCLSAIRPSTSRRQSCRWSETRRQQACRGRRRGRHDGRSGDEGRRDR